MGAAIDDLLTEAFTDPSGVMAVVDERLPTATPTERCQLLRARGNACRELRRTSEARSHHQEALHIAEGLGDERLEGLSAMSLSATLTYDGEFERALELIDRAVKLLAGDDRLLALSQRAGILQRAARPNDALAAFDEAFASLDGTNDPSIEGDLLVNRGVLLGWLGDIDAAEIDTQRALDMWAAAAWTKRVADQQHNLAWLAGRRGDIVSALRYFDLAEATYEQADVPSLSIFPDRCETLLAAGLAREALATAERSAAALADSGDHVDEAEALLLVARAALLAGRTDRARDAATLASELFERQQRVGWAYAADAMALEARLRSGDSTRPDVDVALAISDATGAAGLDEASIDARLLAADIAARLSDWDACNAAIAAFDETPLGLVARFRLARVQAQIAAAHGRRDEAFEICRTALDDFADLSGALGGTEMRASIAIHATRLASLGLKLALEQGDPDTVLQWAERQRASALAPPPVQPPEDAELEHDLTELRTALLALDESGRAGVLDRAAEGRVAMAQERVRRAIQRMPGGLGYHAAAVASAADLADAGTSWAVFLQSERRQFVIYVRGTDVELVDLGSVDDIERATVNLNGSVALHLRAQARGVDRDPAPILAAAARLDTLLFDGFDGGSDRVVVCPVGVAYNLPWGLLPTLRDTSFVLTPSIAAYLRCQRIEPLEPRRVVAVAGPRLELAEAEARAVATVHGCPALVGSDADADNVKRAISGADIVHIACHGRFEVESPMFSSLELHGGPMFVHEFERLRPCARVAVLSACHAGNHTSPAEREILGLAASLVAAGARSVVAATFAVPDSPATVAIMRGVHESLASGEDVASALLMARLRDPLLGGAFVCHGAGWG